MIEPYRPRREVVPYRPTCLDIETETEANGEIGREIGIGFAWQDASLRMQYESFDAWEEWLEFYIELVESFPKSSKLRTRLRRIYAHNGAGFDWLHLVRRLEDHKLIESLTYITSGSNGIGMDIHIEGVDGVVHLRDSMRLMPASLKELSKAFGIPAKIELDALPAVIKARDDVLFWSYLKTDTLNVAEILYGFWSKVYAIAGNIEELPMTLPALAMKLWRKTLTGPVFVPWNAALKAFERRAYSGGRTECFHAGVFEDVRVYDINSLYPAVMMFDQFPLDYRGCWTFDWENKPGLYEVDFVQTNRVAKAVLRDEESGEFRYQGHGVYTHPEIAKLLSVGGEIDCSIGYLYENVGNPFKSFIETWYAVKVDAERNDDSGMRYVAKILMNSLYGKFGQHESQWTLKYLSMEEIAAKVDAEEDFRVLGGYCLVQEDSVSDYTFCGLASYITSFARLRLYDHMAEVEARGGVVLATDTDSEHVIGAEVPTSDALGDMKLEYFGEAAYVARKLYALKGGGEYVTPTGEVAVYKPKLKHKGVVNKKDQTYLMEHGVRVDRVMTYEDFAQMATDVSHSIEVHYQTFGTWREIFARRADPAVMIERKRTVRQIQYMEEAAD